MATAPSRLPLRLGALAAPVSRRGARRAFLAAAAAAIIMLFAGAAAARADSVQVDAFPVSSGLHTIYAGDSVVWTYWIVAQSLSGDIPGCNADEVTPAVVTIETPPEVAVSPKTLTFTGCGLPQPVTLTSTVVGRHFLGVTVSDTGGGSYIRSGAITFLDVLPRPNTAPAVAVTGVVDGAVYEFGQVPAAVCEINDAEDGVAIFPASLSDVSGPLASLGLGQQTASCAYVDTGGLSASAAATYTIVDTTAPTLVALDVTSEATGPDGATVNYAVNASDAVDPAPSVTCAPPSGQTFPLGSSTVECIATDAAGNERTGGLTVTVVDTTPPVLDLPAGVVAESRTPLGTTVEFTTGASDIVDGAIAMTCSHASGQTFPVGETAVTCSASDAAGNVATGRFVVTVTFAPGPNDGGTATPCSNLGSTKGQTDATDCGGSDVWPGKPQTPPGGR